MTQSVLVTAGGSGIGLAIAKAFLQTGADVHLVDQDQEALAKRHPSQSRISGDLH